MSFSVVLSSFFFLILREMKRTLKHFKVTQYGIANVLSIFHIMQCGTQIFLHITNLLL